MESAKKKRDVKSFIKLTESYPVIDVRSPAEFDSGHIPGAYNIPLLDNSGREEVGIEYNREGRIKAIFKGLELVAPEMVSKLEQGLKFAEKKKLLVYCWRGGIRSEAMSWLFNLADIETDILAGGYKSYRRFIFQKLFEKRNLIVFGGLTGSGKTEILKYIKSGGQEIIDLEGLANHKGSAFGSLGQSPQPTSEHFANLLFGEWVKIDNKRTIWIEDESKNIGSVFMPDKFFENMQEAPLIVLVMDKKARIHRLVNEYSGYPVKDLRMSILKINKRLGGEKTKDSIKAIEEGDFEKAIEICLNYYDKTYLYSLKQRTENNVHYIQTDTADIAENAIKVLESAKRILKTV